MSLPYHIGNGVFGGLVPFIGLLIIEYSKTAENPGGQPLSGLWYPIVIAATCFVIGSIFLSNKEKVVKMPALKRVLGITLMLLAPLTIAVLLYFAFQKLSNPASNFNDILQWSIIILIFAPISTGLVVFGKYAYDGEYDKMENT